MSILKDGATYRFENRADGNRSLNVYGNSPSILANVCLWTSDDDDICQQWIYEEESGDRGYLRCKGASNLYLDVYTGSGASTVVGYNAHAYTKSNTAYLEIKEISGGYVRIKSMYNGRYLTANQNSNGTSGGKDVNAAGNVYFYGGGLTDRSQDWLPILLKDNPNTGDEPLREDIVLEETGDEGYYLSQLSDKTFPYPDIVPTDNFGKYGCSAVAMTIFARFMEKDDTISARYLYEIGMWGTMYDAVRGIVPWANWHENHEFPGADEPLLSFDFSDPLFGWNAAAPKIFDEIVEKQHPVIIHLISPNGSDDGTHFVVARGIAAGATRDNLQYSDILVYDPWEINNDTLQKTMNYSWGWSVFNSIRYAVMYE